jgi:NHL repeat
MPVASLALAFGSDSTKEALVKRTHTILAALAMALALAGCVGNTDPATNITTTSAQLNAHGYTDDGPATWWWEYDSRREDIGTANDTEVCGNPPEPDRRCGPAEGGSAQNQIPVSVRVTKLTPNDTYFFRACGQDLGEGPICGSILSFTTLAGRRYDFDLKWGAPGTTDGRFSLPEGVATDRFSNVYVADTGNDRIQRFGPTGRFLGKWGSRGGGDGQFRSPRDVAADAVGNVYVADTGNHRVQKFNSSGSFITKWGTQGSGNLQFQAPVGIAIDSDGLVYVADVGSGGGPGVRIRKFDSGGGFITAWGSFGDGDGQFFFPSDVATDGTINAYVADAGQKRIQRFSSTGSFITAWGSAGSGDGEFQLPWGVATDPFLSVYVVDSGNDRIQKFGFRGSNFITKWGSEGTGDGQFHQPAGIATDSSLNVYVADRDNNRIQRFKAVE